MAKKIQRKFFQYSQIKKLRVFLRGMRKIQQMIRAKIERKRFLAIRQKVVRLQRFFRQFLARKNLGKQLKQLRRMCAAATKISSIWKGTLIKREFLKKKKAANILTRNLKIYLSRTHVRNARIVKTLLMKVILISPDVFRPLIVNYSLGNCRSCLGLLLEEESTTVCPSNTKSLSGVSMPKNQSRHSYTST
jgi:hypothetical protein